MRKIIQIQLDSQPSCSDWNGFQELYALCDDGTLWMKRSPAFVPEDPSKNPWIRLNEVPREDA